MRFLVLGIGLLAVGAAIALAVAPDTARQSPSKQPPAFVSAENFSERVLVKPQAAAIPQAGADIARPASLQGATKPPGSSDAQRAGARSIWAEPARFAPPGT